MPTQTLMRPVSLPNMGNSGGTKAKDLGIAVKGNDILKRPPSGSSRRLYKPVAAPPSTPRITLLNERPSSAVSNRPQSAKKEQKKEQEGALPNGWRPSSAVRRLGEIEIPSVEESTVDMMELVRSAHALRQESAEVNKGYNDMISAFKAYDKLDRGFVSRDQFKRVLRHFTVDLNRNQVENLLKRSDLVDDWNYNRLPYRVFLDRYMERGRSGYIRHSSPVTGNCCISLEPLGLQDTTV
eukprot:sb/3469119/